MKPKYNLFKNTLYAISGFFYVIKERAFQLELLAFGIAVIILFFLSYPLWAKIFMFASLLIPLIVESLNTAIERNVDLVTKEFHPLAKEAKDIASFSVMLSLIVPISVWSGFILYFN